MAVLEPEYQLGLSMGWVRLGLWLTCNRPDQIGWMEKGPVANRMFGSNPVARVIGWGGWNRRVILGLNPNKIEIRTQTTKKSKPK